MQSTMTQTAVYEHGNTLFANSYYCGIADATGTLETKVAHQNEHGVWGILVSLFDYSDGGSHQILVISPAGYTELQTQMQAQTQTVDEDMIVVVGELDKQYIVESETMRLIMTVAEISYLDDYQTTPLYYFGRIRLNFEVSAK